MTDFEHVRAFRQKFGFELPTSPRLIAKKQWKFQLKHLREELDELKKGCHDQDLPKIADAILDLAYVALGTAALYGLPWQELFDEVQRANMSKERCTRAEDSPRGSTHDVIKPPGWKPPDIKGVLLKHGWDEKA